MKSDLAAVLARVRPRSDAELAAQEAAESQRQAGLHVAKLAADFGSRYALDRARFASYEARTSAQKQAVKLLQDFTKNLAAHVAMGRCIVLYGTVGTGKDHLMAATMYSAAAQGFSCRRVNGQDLYAGVRDTFDKTGATEAAFLQRWTEPEILGLSDPVPPIGELTPWRKELLYRLVNRRYEFLRPTWVTVNVNSVEEADQKLGQQVWDRLQENGLLIPCLWPSYRERKK